jgi:hypothetical protein
MEKTDEIKAWLSENARKLGKIGGAHRMASMTQEQRRRMARKGGKARWAKHAKTVPSGTSTVSRCTAVPWEENA